MRLPRLGDLIKLLVPRETASITSPEEISSRIDQPTMATTERTGIADRYERDVLPALVQRLDQRVSTMHKVKPDRRY